MQRLGSGSNGAQSVRDYAKISAKFWTGTTGKDLKAKGMEAVIVGVYLMSCPNSNMLGLYWLPKLYLEHETGLGLEGARKGLAWAIEAGFCEYDEASEVVWVKEMAAFQIAESLKPADNRCSGVQREYDALPENPYLTRFYARYATAFSMTNCRGKQKGPTRGFKAPTKPRAGAGAGAGGEGLPARGCRIPENWKPETELLTFAEGLGLRNGKVSAEVEKFRDYWAAQPGQKGVKTDWPATWRNWCRRVVEDLAGKPGATAADALFEGVH